LSSTPSPPPGDSARADAHPYESTVSLLASARAGDTAARERLFERVMPPLRHWAHQRMPSSARDLNDTEDLVQVTVMRGLQKIDQFESRGPGAFLGYLRTTLLNALRDELRRTSRRPDHSASSEWSADSAPSPLEAMIGREMLDRYERALATLSEEDREAVLLRIEMGFSHQEIADALRIASANAARMRVARALLVLAKAMRDV
jgi:RNA polymerase sigma-70 factor (ECF subfamily)